MQHALAPQQRAERLQYSAGVVVRLAGMDDYRHVEFDRQLQLALEHVALYGPVGVVVVIVQADLADGEDALVRCPGADSLLHLVAVGACLVGVYALGAPDVVGDPGQFQHPVEIGRGHGDGDDTLNSDRG